jgi:hypothetical protein
MEIILNKLIDNYVLVFRHWQKISEVFNAEGGEVSELLDSSRNLIFDLVGIPESENPTKVQMKTGNFFSNDYWLELLYDYASGDRKINKEYLIYELINWR